MASRPFSSAASATPSAINIGMITLHPGTPLHRVHKEIYPADAFNPSTQGNARFSPIHDSQGRVIPTIYAAHTFDGAVIKTVFHEVPYAPGPKQFSQAKLVGMLYSCLITTTALSLADLTSIALRGMGVQRTSSSTPRLTNIVGRRYFEWDSPRWDVHRAIAH